MATVKQVIAANTGAGSRATQYRKSAAASARAFGAALRAGSARAKRAFGVRGNSRNKKNLGRRKTLGGMGG